MKIILGPPGTGKTNECLGLAKKAIEKYGVDQVAYVTFTNKAADEAAARLGQKKPAHFRTIHSTAYRALGMGRDEVMNWTDYKTLGDALGLRFSRFTGADETTGATEGDKIRSIVDYASATLTNPNDVLIDRGEEIDLWKLQKYISTLVIYKEDTDKIDFNDMLKKALGCEPLGLDVAIIDEVQDLSLLQWKVVETLFAGAEFIIAGDDDQAVFTWAGADVQKFLGQEGEFIGLRQSYRVPRAVQRLAMNQVSKIKQRFDKPWAAREAKGKVDFVGTPENVDFSREGTYYLLCRNGYLLLEWAFECRNKGVPYTIRGKSAIDKRHIRAIRAWGAFARGDDILEDDQELMDKFIIGPVDQGMPWYSALLGIPLEDANFYRAILARGGSLDDAPRFHINTIHGVKGGQADHVCILTDVTKRTWESALIEPDAEHRVWYVGMTRARESLTIVAPQQNYFYDI